MSTIKYTIRKCKLNTGTVFKGRVKSTMSFDHEQLIDEIVRRGSTLTRTDVLAVLHSLQQVIKDSLSDGYRVTLGDLVKFYPTIQGEFTSITDSINHRDHSISFGVTAGPGLKKLRPGKIHFERVVSAPREPEPLHLYVSETMREPGGPVGRGTPLTVKGRYLQFDAAREDEGVFLQPGGGKRSIRMKTVLDNRFSKIIFILPESVPQGDYTLRIVSRMGQFETPRSGRYLYPITVQ
jgi:hypothetical protein